MAPILLGAQARTLPVMPVLPFSYSLYPLTYWNLPTLTLSGHQICCPLTVLSGGIAQFGPSRFPSENCHGSSAGPTSSVLSFYRHCFHTHLSKMQVWLILSLLRSFNNFPITSGMKSRSFAWQVHFPIKKNVGSGVKSEFKSWFCSLSAMRPWGTSLCFYLPIYETRILVLSPSTCFSSILDIIFLSLLKVGVPQCPAEPGKWCVSPLCGGIQLLGPGPSAHIFLWWRGKHVDTKVLWESSRRNAEPTLGRQLPWRMNQIPTDDVWVRNTHSLDEAAELWELLVIPAQLSLNRHSTCSYENCVTYEDIWQGVQHWAGVEWW